MSEISSVCEQRKNVSYKNSFSKQMSTDDAAAVVLGIKISFLG